MHNQKELVSSVRNLLNDPSLIAALGQHAKELIAQNQGATQRNLDFILSLVKT